MKIKGIKVLDILEFKKDVVSVCKKCNCRVDYFGTNTHGKISINIKIKNYGEAKYFCNTFMQCFSKKYNIENLEDVWDISGIGEGYIYFINYIEKYEGLILYRDKIIFNNLRNVYAKNIRSSEGIIKELKKAFLTVCKSICVADSDGNFNNSFKVSTEISGVIKISILFEEECIINHFLEAWIKYFKSIGTEEKIEGNYNAYMYMFNETIHSTESSRILEGYVRGKRYYKGF